MIKGDTTPMKRMGLMAALLLISVAPALGAVPPLLTDAYRNPICPQHTNALAAGTNYAFMAWVGGFASDTVTGPMVVDAGGTTNLVLARTSMGVPMVGMNANFELGEILDPPEGADLTVAPTLNFLGGPECAVWIEYEKMLISSDMGVVQATWTLEGGGSQSIIYTVSPNPAKRPVRLYWTEGQNAGPRIMLGSNYRADLHYNSQITSNEVWIADSLVHAAQGAEGRILLTYSRLDEGTGKRRLLAYEVVDVLEPMSAILDAHVGNRLLPKSGAYSTDGLFPEVTRGAVDPSGQDTPFVYVHDQGAKAGWVWAIRETSEPWEIEIYWKAKEELDVLWPFEVDIYDVTWSSNAQVYVRGDTASGDYAPVIPIPTGLSVEPQPHQKPEGHAVVSGSSFFTTSEGYALLKYVREEEVWFEAVRSVSCNDPMFGRTNITAWTIPDELRPVEPGAGTSREATHGAWPGYLADGACYNIERYVYPTVYADPASLASWLFPVNRGEVEIWWSNASTQEGLPEPLYFPSLVNRYACAWPAQAPEIVIASGKGSQGVTLSNDDGRGMAFDRAGLSLEEMQLYGAHLICEAPNSLSFYEELTIECWIKPANLSGIKYLVSKGNNYRLRLVEGEPQVRLGGAWYGMGVPVAPGVWQHLAVTLNDEKWLTFFLDGVVQSASMMQGALLVDGLPLRIGARADDPASPEDFYTGEMDELRIWALARTAGEIEDDRQVVIEGGSAGLRAYYRFEEDARAAEGLVSDHSAFGNHLTIPGAGVAFSTPGVRQGLPGVDLSGVDVSLYYQNDQAVDGFNPNEEHAIILQGVAYALRNDLNVTNAASPDYTSDPFVLLNAQSDDIHDGRPYMLAFRVVASNSLYRFQRSWTAGFMIQPPMPIASMPPWCTANKQIAGPEYRDRKGDYWAKQAGDLGGTTNYVFEYYYPMQDGFFFPELMVQPAIGAELAWLDVMTGDDTPVDLTYVVHWPESVPTLYIGDTLTNPKNGLPAVRGQLSAVIAYQQSGALNANKPSVQLIDPTVSRSAPLEEIPGGMSVYRDVRTACWFFNDLSPALRAQLFFDPNASLNQELKFIGNYIERTDGYNYLHLNTLIGANREACVDADLVKGITGADGDPWRAAVGVMPTEPVVLTDDETPFDSLALPTTGLGEGYVTLVFNDSEDEDMVDPSENVLMTVLRVAPELFVGRLDVLENVNPLDRMLSVYYTADFQGKPERFEFKWEWADPVSGSAPLPSEHTLWHDYMTATGRHHVTIGDAGVFGLSDHYLRCAYRAVDPGVQSVVGTNWTAWTPPVLCEGWIKRVMKAITPFDQRVRDFMSYAIDSSLSMIGQIGPPYAGDVPLNLEALNENGLLAIYETVARQAEKLSIESDFVASDSLALALLMVRGRLADLYMVLGHEAYGDAMNPTVLLSGEDPLEQSMEAGDMPSLFCFKNQVPSLLDEELALLRGRNGDMNPPVTTYPVYNRLAWNLTSDIIGGQVAYALNYGISDLQGNADGVLDAGDAAILYPQGHGDAYGHYLSALKGYHRYLHHTNFAWYPQVEGILVGDTEVTVSYLHEKKFVSAAAARAKSAVGIVQRTWRADYRENEPWRQLRDDDPDQAWGASEWGSRGGMGAYFDWLTANSLLPENADSDASGIRVIDRHNVPELPELAATAQQIQQVIDSADGGLNPLGIAPNAVPFDISPSQLDEGIPHFEQVYERALAALQNAASVAVRVKSCAQAIRDQNDSDDLHLTIQEEEAAFTRRLIELYGYPYADDIGPGKIYAQGYNGPDLLHYMYVDTWPIDPTITTDERTLTLTWQEYTYTTQSRDVNLQMSQSALSDWFTDEDDEDAYSIVSSYYDSSNVVTMELNVANNGVPKKPANYTGKRRAEGEVQMALSEYLAAVDDVYSAVGDAQYISDELKRQGELWLATQEHLLDGLYKTVDTTDEIRNLQIAVTTIESVLQLAAAIDDMQSQLVAASTEALPKVVGLANDTFSAARSIIRYTYSGVSIPKLLVGVALHGTINGLQLRMEDLGYVLERELMALDIQQEGRQAGVTIQGLMQQQVNSLSTVQASLQRAETARMELMARISEGDQLQIERERLRMNWAADLSARRYRNMAYRLFLNDELSRREESFQTAARYVYLAAKAYDYETGLLETDDGASPASAFLGQIVRARTLGRFADWTQVNVGEPLAGAPAGEPGLADAMARMKANWNVLKGRLGFNNPQTETGRFSLRTELFRLSPDAASDESWAEILQEHRVDNLRDIPEFSRYCIPFDPMQEREPALVIPFSTCIHFGKNVFGRTLAGGDNAYDSTHFATKIRSVGVWFANYNAAISAGLANQPRIYLFPAGADSMRVPLASSGAIRTWDVVDQIMPLPYPLSDIEWEQPDWSAMETMLGGSFRKSRRFPGMLAYHDDGDDDSLLDVSWNSRLVGRSVWNSKWLLIIPGGTLLSDGEEGLARFINGAMAPDGGRDGNGIKDIKLYFHTYSYGGN